MLDFIFGIVGKGNIAYTFIRNAISLFRGDETKEIKISELDAEIDKLQIDIRNCKYIKEFYEEYNNELVEYYSNMVGLVNSIKRGVEIESILDELDTNFNNFGAIYNNAIELLDRYFFMCEDLVNKSNQRLRLKLKKAYKKEDVAKEKQLFSEAKKIIPEMIEQYNFKPDMSKIKGMLEYMEKLYLELKKIFDIQWGVETGDVYKSVKQISQIIYNYKRKIYMENGKYSDTKSDIKYEKKYRALLDGSLKVKVGHIVEQ